jgi:hypothetical protein
LPLGILIFGMVTFFELLTNYDYLSPLIAIVLTILKPASSIP